MSKCITPIHIIPNNNQVVLLDNNKSITIIDNNCCTEVIVTQPVTEVIQVLTGPMGKFPTEGPYGFTGSFDISGSFTTTGSIYGDIIYSPYFTGSFFGNGVGLFSGSFSGSVSSNLQEITDNGSTTTNAITSSGLLTNDINVNGNVVVSGSLLVSGSNTFKNIGPAQFTGSTDITGSLSVNGVDYEFTSASLDQRIINNSSSITFLSSSYLNSSASFNTRILNNSSSISLLSGSFLNFSGSYVTHSSSFNTRILNNSSSISLLSGSYLTDSASFNTRILNNSSSISTLSSSFLSFSSSYLVDSSSFNIRIVNNSSSINILSGSYLTDSASFNTRILNNSSSISSLSGSFVGFSGSYVADSASFNTRILNNSSSINILSGSYLTDSASFNTRILNNSSSISTLSSSFIGFSGSYVNDSSSFNVRIIDLENFSSSLDATFATDAELNAATASLSSSISYLSSSYLNSSASFDIRILNNSSSINLLSGSFIGFSGSYVNDSSSFNTRILNNSSSITAVSSSLSIFSGSYVLDSASFDTRILNNSSSIDILSSSFETFTQIYNTGSFTGSFTGSLLGTASWAINAQTASYVLPLNQDVIISGSLKLDPTQDPDPSGLDLDSTVFFQSSSNTSLGYDLYIRQDGNLVKWKWIEGIVNTGLLYGGVVTYSGTDIFVSPGSGIIVNHNATTGSEISPIVEYVTWSAITQSITNIATQQVTYLYIDNSGTLQQQSTRFTNEQYHDYIPLGAVGHFDYTQVSAFGGKVQTAYDQVAQISSFIDAFGPLKISGYGITGQPETLRLSVGSGISFIHGGFYENDPEIPSQITTPAQATASMAYVYRSGSGIVFDTNGGNLYTELKPGFYDPGTGVTGSVSNNDWTIQRVYSDPKTGVLYVYFGQNIYPDFLTAVADLSTDSFTEGDTFDFTTFIGFLVLKSNGTDITAADNKIIPAGLFRGSGQGSGGGIAISNLDDLTDVSITGPTNGEALIYDSGVWQNGIPLNATSASFAINAQTASFAISSSTAVSASFTQTASYAFTAVTASYALNGGIDTGSLLVTASVALNTITFTKGDGSTFPITVDTGSGGGGGSVPAGVLSGSFGITIDGAGSAITTGEKGYAIIPYAGTITGWTMIADQSGSCVIDVWKAAGTIPTVGGTITGTEKPTLSSQQINSDINLTSWTTTVAAGDVVAFNVDSTSLVTRVNLSIYITKQ